jgi:hypothetical protein
MRKNTSFTVAAAIMGLAVIFWAKSSVVATSADTRSTVGMSFYAAATTSYLPFQVVEPIN